MEINVIINADGKTTAWHINPTRCDLSISMIDGSLTITPKDSAWVQVLWDLDVATDQQIDPTVDPWPAILAKVAARAADGEAARAAAAEKNAKTKERRTRTQAAKEAVGGR